MNLSSLLYGIQPSCMQNTHNFSTDAKLFTIHTNWMWEYDTQSVTVANRIVQKIE